MQWNVRLTYASLAVCKLDRHSRYPLHCQLQKPLPLTDDSVSLKAGFRAVRIPFRRKKKSLKGIIKKKMSQLMYVVDTIA